MLISYLISYTTSTEKKTDSRTNKNWSLIGLLRIMISNSNCSYIESNTLDLILKMYNFNSMNQYYDCPSQIYLDFIRFPITVHKSFRITLEILWNSHNLQLFKDILESFQLSKKKLSCSAVLFLFYLSDDFGYRRDNVIAQRCHQRS